MKTGILTLFLFCMSVMLYGQKFAVSADKMNVLYIGVDNPLTVVAEGYKCDQLEIACGGSTIRKTGDCGYNIVVTKEGILKVEVKARTASGVKSLGIKIFRCKLIPSPRATILGRSSGLIPVANFKVQLGIFVQMDGFDFEAQFKVSKFKMAFTRDDKLIYSCVTNGPYFDKVTREQMQTLRSGDKISITDIKAIGPDSRERTLNDINLSLN